MDRTSSLETQVTAFIYFVSVHIRFLIKAEEERGVMGETQEAVGYENMVTSERRVKKTMDVPTNAFVLARLHRLL